MQRLLGTYLSEVVTQGVQNVLEHLDILNVLVLQYCTSIKPITKLFTVCVGGEHVSLTLKKWGNGSKLYVVEYQNPYLVIYHRKGILASNIMKLRMDFYNIYGQNIFITL